MKKYIYIDYENLPGVEVEDIEDATILIFLGENQKKIPTETIRRTQPMGDRVEWITISGAGRNALDFHIAYYLRVGARNVALRFSTDRHIKINIVFLLIYSS